MSALCQKQTFALPQKLLREQRLRDVETAAKDSREGGVSQKSARWDSYQLSPIRTVRPTVIQFEPSPSRLRP
jgi:hypothetical protein